VESPSATSHVAPRDRCRHLVLLGGGGSARADRISSAGALHAWWMSGGQRMLQRLLLRRGRIVLRRLMLWRLMLRNNLLFRSRQLLQRGDVHHGLEHGDLRSERKRLHELRRHQCLHDRFVLGR
jgi:hypothetical protein